MFANKIGLDEAQKAAVEAIDRLLVVLAGPGSGKTRVIVERIAHLVENRGIRPERILAITFTVKAALELERRLVERLEAQSSAQPRTATFHSLCFDILKTYGGAILPVGWRLATAREQRETFFRAHGKKPSKHLVEAVSMAKIERGVTIHPPTVSALLAAYEAELRNQKLLDFDDLLTVAHDLLAGDATIQTQVAARYEHIIVDEHQDSNALQCTLLELLAHPHNNLCVVGDPNQAIYAFRGASSDGLLRFSERPETKKVVLDTNYRSTQTIVRAATAFIADSAIKNATSTTEVLEHEPLRIVVAPTAASERAWILKTIESMLGGTDYATLEPEYREAYAPGDIAVIYRTNTMGDFLEDGFRASGLPYRRSGGKNFFDHPEVRAVVAALATLDEVSRSLAISDQLRACLPSSTPPSDRLLELLTIAAQFDHLPPEEGRNRMIALASLAAQEQIPLPQMGNTITLLTAHAAKGLEFRAVFIAGAEEGLFPYAPHPRASIVENDLAEERRLFYVAMTRAKERLLISSSSLRMQFGVQRGQQPSRFLSDIPDDYCVHEETSLPRRRIKPQASLF
jgi:DNA helicase-2/ATP-dependent DNA helicase PcrA